MSQHDLDIANQGFPATRADINNALQALGSSNSGATAPSTIYANQLWYDTANNILKIRNEDNDAWISVLYLDQTNDVVTQLDVDNIRIDGNTISSTDTNGDITLDPNGTGEINLSSNVDVTGTVTAETSSTGEFNALAIHQATNSSGDEARIQFKRTTDGGSDREVAAIVADRVGGNDTALAFETNTDGSDGATERVRITQDGDLLVSKTAIGTGTVGVEARSDGLLAATRDANKPLLLNRLTSDGSIIQVQKDGTTVGSIGTGNGLFVSAGSKTGIRFPSGHWRPMNNGFDSDNAIDLGSASYRFDDIFATNTTIQTSDQTEKQQIASLTTAEMTAAKAISKLFKTFRWNSAVQEKGDAARIHAGVIAQEVKTAMTDAGLNATNYAFWCSNTWWETSTDVPAIEGVAEVLDDDGNVVTEAVEAQDAYTRIDTYETADEAPEGATERTRLGIRYPELLAFIGAATEQRLADLETRVAALEA